MLGIIGLVVALFIPFIVVVLGIFETNVAAILIGVFIPFVALSLGIIGILKSSRQSTSFTKSAKILNIITIIIGALLIIFNLYVFIKSGSLGI
jgi:uncharacterized membrane protein YqaE (UPF0057 family)